MIKNRTVGIVIPAYNEERQIGTVISSLPEFVDSIVVVDDGSTDHTAREALRFGSKQELIKKLTIIRRDSNRGVGRAIADGYKWMAEKGLDVVVVMAGDGQMDPRELPKVIGPVVDGRVDYVKGNRLRSSDRWKKIPKNRLVGNAVLSLLTKAVSGYFSVIDSQSGYTAISSRALRALDLDRIYEGYGVPNDILTKLNIRGFPIAQVPIEPIYNIGEQSKMRVGRVVFPISILLVKLFFLRLFSRYLVREFHPVFFLYLAGIALLLAGSLGGGTMAAVDFARRLGMESGIEPRFEWMVLLPHCLLSGLNLLLVSIWIDMQQNQHLQIDLPAESRDAPDRDRPGPCLAPPVGDCPLVPSSGPRVRAAPLFVRSVPLESSVSSSGARFQGTGEGEK